jgi:hypothetical protein
MASFKCPHCGSLQTIPLEEFAPGFVGAPALFLGCVFGALSRIGFWAPHRDWCPALVPGQSLCAKMWELWFSHQRLEEKGLKGSSKESLFIHWFPCTIPDKCSLKYHPNSRDKRCR